MTLSFCFLQFLDYLSSFFLGREFDSASRALFFTACTEHYTIIRILHDSSLCSLVPFKLVRAELTVVYAFSATDAFFIINCRVPRYLASWNTVICFSAHFSVSAFCCVSSHVYIAIFKYLYELLLIMPSKSSSLTRFRAKIFNALSDPVRLEIIEFLRDGEKCVCEITPHLKLIQPVVSRHLKILKAAGLVKRRKKGTWHMYSITDPGVCDLIDSLTPELIGSLKQRMIEQLA
jgi:DNA-binding transcriptional ArsR family regulator